MLWPYLKIEIERTELIVHIIIVEVVGVTIIFHLLILWKNGL